MSSRSLLLAVVIAAIALTATGAAWVLTRPKAPTIAASTVQIGGPFQLIDMQGRPVSEKTLLGKPTAIFFGFTYCPEICPTTLTEMTGWLKALSKDADKLNAIFVSVDPERDTPEQLRLYLANFDPRIQGFTGTPEQVAAVTKGYRVYYKKIPTDGGGYTVDHSAAVYLFDAKGRFVEPIGYGAPPDRAVAQLKALVR